jgi:hypothetical protein
MNNLNFFSNKCSCEASHLRDGVNHGPMRPYGVICRRCLHLVRRLGRNMRYVIDDFHFFAENMLMRGLIHAPLR